MTLQWLLSDWNLAFALPLVLALVYLGLYVVSGVTFGDPGDAGGDTDGHFVAHVDAHAEADANADADVHGDDLAHHHGAHDPAAHHNEPGPLLTVLSYFGVGRVPLSMLLSATALGWGVGGLVAASALRDRPAGPWPAVAIVAAVAGAMLSSRAITLLLTRLVPIQETYARRRHALLGSTGEAIYPIDESFGMVGVRDDRGGLFQVGCRAGDGVGTIPKGSTVKLVAYNADTKLYKVVPAEAPAAHAATG